jgi:HEAT repeat protein
MMGHESGEVRQEALRCLIKRGELPTEKILGFLQDGDPQVRFRILNHLGQERNPMVERLLRDHIDQVRFGNGDSHFLKSCYQVFGKCASDDSLSFLTNLLFDQALFGNMRRRRSWHRQGAAIALMELKTQEAKTVLKKASRSFYPGIRKAYKKALEFKLGVK